jgi:antitoxin VapB
MILEAKTFKNGNSQAVRLPKECRFNSKKVLIKKIADGIVLLEDNQKTWENWWNSFEKADLIREQGKQQEREELF